MTPMSLEIERAIVTQMVTIIILSKIIDIANEDRAVEVPNVRTVVKIMETIATTIMMTTAKGETLTIEEAREEKRYPTRPL